MGATQHGLNETAIVDAVQRAEEKCSAEIFAVFARQSDDYRFVGYAVTAFWIFMLSVFLVLWLQVDPGYRDWGDEAIVPNGLSLQMLVLGQLFAFVSAALVFHFFPALRLWVVPHRTAHERAHANAVRQFLAHGIHKTEGGCGVLVFVSQAERYAEILVDKRIEEVMGREVFLEMVARLTRACEQDNTSQGYVNTINELGDRLSEFFPPDTNQANELEDRLVVI